MSAQIIAYLIFAGFVGILLFGFWFYTKYTEKRIKKEMQEKTDEAVREIYANSNKFVQDMVERLIADKNLTLEQIRKVEEYARELEKIDPNIRVSYKGEIFN